MRWMRHSGTSGDTGDRHDYVEWVRRYDTLDDLTRERIRDKISSWQDCPTISMLMPVYDPPLAFLDQAIASVRAQLYPHWELCIADDLSTNPDIAPRLRYHAAQDSRIKLVLRTTNGHIVQASNSALEMASGEYVGLLDHDDVLPDHALYAIACAIRVNPRAGLIYSDEDKIDRAGIRRGPYFKPDWNLDLLRSHNMISHLGVYRTSLVRQVGAFRPGFEGSQDYDLALRCIEQLTPAQIVHVPRVLYHWRIHEGSTALSNSAKPYAAVAAQRALDEHLARLGVRASVDWLENTGYQVKYEAPRPSPRVTLVMIAESPRRVLARSVDSILKRTTFDNFGLCICLPPASDVDIQHYVAGLSADSRVTVAAEVAGSTSRGLLINHAVRAAGGVFVVLLDDDLEVMSPDWLTEMISVASQPGVGAVGARLWYADNRLEHAGFILGIANQVGRAHRLFPRGAHGYCGRASLRQSLSAVSDSCLLMPKQLFEQAGGLEESIGQDGPDAASLQAAGLCLRIGRLGYRTVFTPFADLRHCRARKRPGRPLPADVGGGAGDGGFAARWQPLLDADPAYNPNLTLEYEDFGLAWPPRTTPLV